MQVSTQTCVAEREKGMNYILLQSKKKYSFNKEKYTSNVQERIYTQEKNCPD